MSKLTKALTAAAGNAGESLYVEDVFSTYLYTGNNTARSINNGVDLTEGGLVWIKNRTSSGSNDNVLYNTETGVNKYLSSNSTSAVNAGNTQGLMAFNNNGFSLGTDNYWNVNRTGVDIASWTFRKAEKFFDVVTYTGNGTAGRTVSHDLGSVPAVMLVKSTDVAGNWVVYHKDIGTTKYLYLNTTAAEGSFDFWNATAPTDTEFTLGGFGSNNASGGTFVAYLFASDAGGFGDDGSESIIKCGSYVGTGSAGLEVDLGFEPQWVLLKASSRSSPWALVDNMRGFLGQNTQVLQANSTSNEFTTGLYNTGSIQCNATGFSVETDDNSSNGSGETYIYIAIRRPMKTPESGTEVFSPSTFAGNDPTPTVITTGFPVDLALLAYRDLAAAGGFGFTPRLTQSYLYSPTTAAEVSTGLAFDSNTSFATDANHWNQSPYNLIGYAFKRATGFFDVVAYTGNGAVRTIPHNLGVAPELILFKIRSTVSNWQVYASGMGATKSNRLNSDGTPVTATAYFNDTAPTDSVFTLGTASNVNWSGNTFISYHFATLAGVSKVGSYTGTGSNVDVDCGFSAGARFILIKRTDSTGDWYVWDTERGITAGNDPYLLLNTTAAEVTSTDYIDPLSSGFTVTSSAPAALNASGGSYIFLAIA